ncbi:MAG: hypothetical protein QF903_01930 [Planctomycetota bacterium]|nr:hypothetical protein [Planctomycetota bacterium]MDP6764152.1 hypothetical protein [Planctomycetota bacterium]MDP6988223.1 hypothetical protein [Planctomycetota bacterium]
MRSPDGRPLAGALVAGLSGEASVILGTTAESGLLGVGPSGTAFDAVLASARGFVTGVAPLDAAADEGWIEVRLAPAEEVHGRVSLEDGSSAGAGIEILAWREGEYPTAHLARRARAGDLRAITAVTDENGSFVLGGVDPDRLYTAVAAGNGFVSPSRTTWGRSPSREVSIVVHRAYAAWIRLREAGGGALRTSPSLYGRRFGGPRSDAPDIGRLGGLGPRPLMLLGSLPVAPSTLADRFYVFTSPRELTGLGPFELALDYPGYERVVARFEVPALEGRAPAEIPVELEPSASTWGTLDVRFLWALSGHAVVDEAEPLGLLRLFEPDGRPCEFAVREAFPSALAVAGLPTGPYEWEFEILSGAGGEPLTPDETAAVLLGEEGAVIEIDLSHLGAIALRLLHLDGSEYEGAAWIRLERAGERPLPARILRTPPYVLSGVSPGTWEVWVDQPRFLDRSTAVARDARSTVVVEPGAVFEADLFLAE